MINFVRYQYFTGFVSFYGVGNDLIYNTTINKYLNMTIIIVVSAADSFSKKKKLRYYFNTTIVKRRPSKRFERGTKKHQDN